MDDVELIYNTNNKWLRSGNPGSATWNPISWVGNAVSREAICYNVGYIKGYKKWRYREEINEDIEFKFTSAHEIGHEILQAYAGTVYSWQHKGSSYYLPQDTKPTKGNETFGDKITHWDEMKNSHGEYYPKNGEIDLMKYYNSRDKKGNFIAGPDVIRTVAAEKDVLGLIWLTKLEIK